MLNAELLKFIREEYAHLSSLNDEAYNQDIEKRAYALNVKLSEEVGELSEALLARFSNQSKRKNGQDFSLEDEIADTLIVLLIMCEHLGIDPDAALSAKINRIIERRKA